MGSRRINVEIVGDAASIEQAFGKASKAGGRFDGVMGKLKLGAAGAAAGGIAVLGKSLIDSVGKAKEAEQAQARLESALSSANVSYAKHGDAIDKAIDKTSKLAAIDDEELSDAFAKLVRTTGNVTKATEGMSLAANIARARNISLEKATGIVEKAMIGQTRGLKSVGVELDKGMTSTQALEKAQAQFAGAAEKHGATAAGAQEKLGVAFENLQEKVGQKLLPVLAKLAIKLTDMITWAETNWPKFQKAAEPVFDAIKVVIDNLIDKIKAIATTVAGIVKIIQGIKDGSWSTVWAGIKQVVVDGLGGIVTATLELPVKILKALGEKAWAGLSAVGGWIKNKILDGLEGIASGVSSAIIGAINAAIGLLNRAIDAYNAIPLLPNVGKVGTIGGGSGKGNTSRIGGRASGGPVSARTPYVVGERGPELFVPGRSGTIIPNRAGRAGVDGTIVNVYVAGSVTSEKDLAERLRDEFIKIGRRTGPGYLGAT